MRENIFNQITDDNIAYWLGFIAADGAIINYRKQLHFQCGLSSKDKEHLEKFCMFMDEPISSIYDRQVKSSNGNYYPASYIELFSDNLVNDLAKYGIIPDKSHQNIDFLSYIPEQYKLPFIFGLIDGDGWFICTEISWSIGFCGNQNVVTSVHKYLHEYFSHWQSQEHIRQYSKSKITYEFNITTQSEVKEFCESYLSYSNKCDLLERKQCTAQKLINILEKRLTRQGARQKKVQEKQSTNTAICPICNKEFEVTHYLQKYCSQECVHKAQYRCNHPDKETLLQLLNKYSGNFCVIARLFGVTDNAVRKWCKTYGLSHQSSDYKK